MRAMCESHADTLHAPFGVHVLSRPCICNFCGINHMRVQRQCAPQSDKFIATISVGQWQNDPMQELQLEQKPISADGSAGF